MVAPSIHFRSLDKSSRIARFQMGEILSPREVMEVLLRGKISFVLVGAYGLAGWMKARATEDVDVVVSLRQVGKAVKLLQEAFGNLEVEDLEVVVRLRNRETGEVAIDVMKPVRPPYREIFRNTLKVKEGKLEYRVPTLEMALTCKFAPMVSLMRADERKYQDAHDFIVMVKQNPDIDLAKLEKLGDSIYGGGGKDLLEMVRRVRAGEKLSL